MRRKYLAQILVMLGATCFLTVGLVFAESKPAQEPAESLDAGSSLQVEYFAKPQDEDSKENSGIEAEKTLKVGFRISDSATGQGVSDLHPAAWVVRRDSKRGKPDQESCERGIKKYSRGGLLKESSGDLNNFYIISLNADNSVGIFNPQISLATSNLLALIPLKGKPSGWIFDQSYGRVYVTLPEEGEVAVVDINQRAVDRYIPVGKHPMRIEQQPDGRYIWVGNEGDGTLSVIDRVERSVVKTLPAGPGKIDFAFDPKGRLTMVASSGDGRLTVFDNANLGKVGDVNWEPGTLHLAYSPISEALYVSDEDSGRIHVLYPATQKLIKTINVSPKVTRLTASPDGRHIFALHKADNALTILDTVKHNISYKVSTFEEPDDVVFSKAFAYIHHAADIKVSIIQLSALTKPDPPPIADIPISMELPKKIPGIPGVSLIDITPDEAGALIANPADKTVYLYMESGMLSVSNSFKTFTAAPLGLFIYDHSLVEDQVAGEYASSLRLERGGTYDVYFLLSNPLVSACFELVVAGAPWEEKASQVKLEIDSLTRDEDLSYGRGSKIRFRLQNSKDKVPVRDLEDLQVLGMNHSGSWQVRKWAKSVGDGVFEVEMVFPKKGKYRVLVASQTLGIKFGRLKHNYVVSGNPAQAH